MSLSVILTCYNEVPFIFNSYEKVASFLDFTGVEYEIIIVDDGSLSRVQAQLRGYFQGKKNTKLIIGERNEGRGFAVTEGIRQSSKEYAGFIDTDLEIPENSLLSLLYAFQVTGKDIIIGWRVYQLDGNINNWLRYFLSRGYFLLANFVLGLGFLDTETGIKLFKRDKILPVLDSVQEKRWFWDTEIIAESVRCGLTIAQVPVFVFRKKGKRSSVRFIRDIWRYFKAINKYRKRRKSG